MRFGLIHRIMTDALAALGVVALVSSGELHPAISWALLIGMALALLIPERYQDSPILRHFGFVGPLSLLGLQVARWSLGADFVPISIEFAAGLQVIRLATRRGAAHDQQVIVLALLHLIAGTVLGGGISYGLCFIGFLVVAPGALVLSHLRREVEGNYRQGARDRTGLPVDVPRILRSRRVIGRPFLALTCLMSIPIFVFTALLFVLFPRVGLSLFMLNRSHAERMVGFSDRVDLGGVGTLRADPTIAMRVHYPRLPPDPPARLALYLRGTAFDHYNGRSWSRSQKRRLPAVQYGAEVQLYRSADPSRDERMRIELEPIDPPVVFLPTKAVALRLMSQTATLNQPQATLFQGPENQLEYDGASAHGLTYEVFQAGPREQPFDVLRPADYARYLALPANLTGRTRDLAREWVKGHTNALAQARAIEARLQKGYRYDLNSPSGATQNPLDHFLFESRRGHCEYYSTAMAVMLRTLGIASRNVTGFVGGTFNRYGRFYAVRQGDAHSWVEAYVPRLGWVRFDPTPAADSAPVSELNGTAAQLRDFLDAASQRWNRHVVGYDLKQQITLLDTVRSRYGSLTGDASFKRAFGSPRKVFLVLLGVGLLAYAIVLIRRRRRNARVPAPQRELERQHTQVVALYTSLEVVLRQHGVARVPSTPPLAHARALMALGHPLAGPVLELTTLYVEARFGGRILSEEERRRFALQVKALRQTPTPLKEAA